MFKIEGETEFNFYDVFTDPIDLRQFAAELNSSPWSTLYFLKFLYTIAKLKTPPPYNTSLEITDNVTSIVQLLTDLGGAKYDIVGNWTASFRADILVDRAISVYRAPKPR